MELSIAAKQKEWSVRRKILLLKRERAALLQIDHGLSYERYLRKLRSNRLVSPNYDNGLTSRKIYPPAEGTEELLPLSPRRPQSSPTRNLCSIITRGSQWETFQNNQDINRKFECGESRGISRADLFVRSRQSKSR
jgi:hypothetical protein